MFVLVLLFCIGGDPNGRCIKATLPPMPMPSAEVCYAISEKVAAFLAVKDGLLEQGFIPVGAQCLGQAFDEPGIES